MSIFYVSGFMLLLVIGLTINLHKRTNWKHDGFFYTIYVVLGFMLGFTTMFLLLFGIP